MTTQTYSRLHMFGSLPNRSQILLYMILVLTILCFYLCVMELFLIEIQKQIFVSIFSILTGLTIFSGILTGQIDPTDKLMSIFMKDKQKFTQYLQQNKVALSPTQIKFCLLCNAKAKSSSSHCGDCNRCIQGRDHHCSYLNICIGSRNYKIFFITICLTPSFLITYVISMAFVTYRIINSNGEEIYLRQTVEFIIGWIVGVIALITWVPLTGLLCFHCYLIKNDITTIQFIKNNKISDQITKNSVLNYNKEQQQIKQEKIMNESQSKQVNSFNDQFTKGIIIHRNSTNLNQHSIKFNQIQNTPTVPIRIHSQSQNESKSISEQVHNISIETLDTKKIHINEKIYRSRVFRYIIGEKQNQQNTRQQSNSTPKR